MSLPVVDISSLASNSDKQRGLAAQALVSSLKQHGFVKLSNHGLSAEVVNALFRFNKKFFNLPLGSKRHVAYQGGSAPARGYVGFGHEMTSQISPIPVRVEKPKDARESFDIGSPSDCQFPNMWPDDAELPGFRQCMELYYASCQMISFRVMQALELGLGVPSGSLTARCIPDDSELRLNHYPQISVNELETGSSRRIWPHTDTGLFTLLLQDRVGGLELEDRQNLGAFLPVSSDVPTDMVLNIADTLERWTNGALKAGVHRVVSPDSTKVNDQGMAMARSSIVYFFRANGATSAGPLPSFVSPEHPAKYSEITALEYLQQRNGTLYTY